MRVGPALAAALLVAAGPAAGMAQDARWQRPAGVLARGVWSVPAWVVVMLGTAALVAAAAALVRAAARRR